MAAEHELFPHLVRSLTRPSLAMTPYIEPGRIQVSAGYSLTAGKASQLVVISGGRCEQLFLEANE